MSLYSVEKLMAETRRLAAEYYKTTGQTLPVTAELANYYAKTAFTLLDPPKGASLAGVDALGQGVRDGQKIQIKGRVIMSNSRSSQRLGQFNMDGEWNVILLVLMDEEYLANEIYSLTRRAIEAAFAEKPSSPKRQKRGVMSVAKFKAIGQLAWTKEDGDLTQI